MLSYEDLIENTKNDYLEKQTKILQSKLQRELDMGNPNDKWLAVTYIYALEKGLKEYQARSFASELTLFITNIIYDTDVSLVYREEWLDSYLYNKFDEFKKEYPNDSPILWQTFIDFMVGFYRSSLSWKYERVSKYLKFHLTFEEKELFESIPKDKPKQKFLLLLKNYDYSLEQFEYERLGDHNNLEWSINLSVGEYDRFMSVLGGTKSEKFRNLLYYYNSIR